jgi:hypothetical protein
MTNFRAPTLFGFLQLLLTSHVSKAVCLYPTVVTETAQTDIQLGTGEAAGDLMIWDGNPICQGTSAPAGCASVGKAYGVCTTLSNKNPEDPTAPPPSRDCVDNFVFPGGSTLSFRAVEVTGVEESMVIGGTGCYWGAEGTVDIIFNEEENSFTYNLTYVENYYDDTVDGDEDEGGALSEKSGVRRQRE